MTRTANAAGESSLGDIIADAQLWATSGPSWPAANGAPAVISFMNSGGIRADINVGPITYGEAFSVQPFANVLVTMDMTGRAVKAVLEQQFTRRQRGAADPGVADLRPRRCRGAGRRPRANIRISGVDLNLAATYRVTVNNFLADGGDNYTVFRRGTNRFVGEIDLDAFARYVEMSRDRQSGPAEPHHAGAVGATSHSPQDPGPGPQARVR